MIGLILSIWSIQSMPFENSFILYQKSFFGFESKELNFFLAYYLLTKELN
jgi:hypothetical protein